jgi:hypothetical protein
MLFIGCRKPAELVAMRTADGKVVGSVAIPAGNDATAYSAGQTFASTHAGTLVVARDAGGKFALEQSVTTAVGARTLGLDPISHKIFLPTAEFESPNPASPNARPKMKPGTFVLIEVDGK